MDPEASSNGLDPLQRLLAIEAIRTVKARYFHAVDTRDWAALRQVFTDDAVFERTDLRSVRDVTPTPVIGGDTIVAWIAERMADAVTVHFGHMPQIELLSATRATGLWLMNDHVETPDQSLRGVGYYRDEYRCEEGVWRIASFRLDRLRVDIKTRAHRASAAGGGR